jgi:hypothetical protein
VTVADVNLRAVHTVESLGFDQVGRFAATTSGRPFGVFVRPARLS